MDIHCPFPAQTSPHLGQVRVHLRRWAHDMGLVHSPTAGLRFDSADFGLLAALVFPHASRTHLELTADWFAWAFLVDDHMDTGRLGLDHLRPQETFRRAYAILRHPGTTVATEPGGPTLLSALADLWARTTADTTAAWQRRFVTDLVACLDTMAGWETHNRILGVVPDQDAYIDKRRHTGGIYPFMDLIPLTHQSELPAEVYDSSAFQAALDAAGNVVVWTNDVYSRHNEHSGGETHNLISVVAHHQKLDRQAALAQVCAMIGKETDVYLGHERRLLGTFPELADVLGPYTAGLRAWMRGNLDWSARTGRYRRPLGDPAAYLEPALVEAEGDHP